MPLTGGAPSVPIRGPQDLTGNTLFEGLRDLNVDLTLGEERVTVAMIDSDTSGESNPALD